MVKILFIFGLKKRRSIYHRATYKVITHKNTFVNQLIYSWFLEIYCYSHLFILYWVYLHYDCFLNILLSNIIIKYLICTVLKIEVRAKPKVKSKRWFYPFQQLSYTFDYLNSVNKIQTLTTNMNIIQYVLISQVRIPVRALGFWTNFALVKACRLYCNSSSTKWH